MRYSGFRALTRLARSFLTDRRASVSVDFVVSIPILLGVLVFTTEYGRILQMRTILDNAVADATRYLSRVPLNDAGTGFSDQSIAIANVLITERVNSEFVNIGAPVVVDVTGQTSSATYRTVTLSAAVGVATPALSVLALAASDGKVIQESGDVSLRDLEGFVLVASDTARHFGR